MLVSSLPCCRHALQLCCWGQLILMWAVPVFEHALQINSLPSQPLCDKYEVSIIVPLFFSERSPVVAPHWVAMVTLHTRLLCLWLHHLSRQLLKAHLLLESLTTFINEIHLPSLGGVSFRTHCSVNAEVSFAALRWSSNNLYHLNNKQLHLITHYLTWHCKCINFLKSRPTNKWYRRKVMMSQKLNLLNHGVGYNFHI